MFSTTISRVVLLLFCVENCLLNVLYERIITEQNIPQTNIHELMIEKELLFYFGTTSVDQIPRYELIKFPLISHIKQLQFTAFNRHYNLNFQRNDKLLSPYFKWFVVNEDNSYEMEETGGSCHYLHMDEESAAAFSFCEEHVNGLIVSADSVILEVISLSKRLHGVISEDKNNNEMIIMVKPAGLDKEGSTFDEDDHFLTKEKENHFGSFMKRSSIFSTLKEASSSRPNGRLTLEAGVFFDEAAYKIFAPYFDHDIVQIKNMLLAYMNMVQALYFEPSIGVPLDIVLVKLEIFKNQPDDLPHYSGERSLLLDSFCNYNKKHNAESDEDLSHWDIGLYISGLDFYSIDNGVRSGGTMGLATVGGICTSKYSCIISEFGTTNEYGKPYPSAGFSSVYILAHEIGHNLGMHHDGTSNTCPKDGFIMSPSRGVYGETVWSSCSASVMRTLSQTAPCLLDTQTRGTDLDHNSFTMKPGLHWSAKRQCEILLKDASAYVMNSTQNMCENLMCQTSHKSGFYHAGPALDGTKCDVNKWCVNQECVQMRIEKNINTVKGGWSEWKNEACKSSCILASKGFQKKTRKCNNPAPVNTDEGCTGSSENTQLCKDDKRPNLLSISRFDLRIYPGINLAATRSMSLICPEKSGEVIDLSGEIIDLLWMSGAHNDTGMNFFVNLSVDSSSWWPKLPKLCKKSKRISAVQYATNKCHEFSSILPILEQNGTGMQAPYEEGRLWTSCSIFCKRKDSDTFYSPRFDLNDLNLDPYFADGTWCHNDGKRNYYCVMHHCLPEGSRTGKSVSFSDPDLLIPQDANSITESIPELLRRYLSVDLNGAPVLTTLKPNIKPFLPNEWFVDLNGE